MKNSILFVLGTLWAFSCLVGKSCPSVIYPFNTDDSNDGAILAKNSNKLDLPRDLSQPVIARFAREVEGEDPNVPIHLLIIIIPVVMGIVVIIIIVLVVCYMCRRSKRGTCISNEWLIWCGLLKRSNPSSVREPGDHRSANASDASVRRGVRYEPGHSAMSPTHGESTVRLLKDSQAPQPAAERGNHTGACPSEWSPNTLPNTPDTGKSSLPPTDDETDRSPHSRTTATEHQSGTPKFTYPNHEEGHIGRITVEQTRAPHKAMYPTLKNISEKENTGDGRDIGKAGTGMDELSPRSGSDDDVFKPGIDGVSDTGSEDIGPGRKRKGACASRACADEDTVTQVNQSPILVNNLPNGSDSMGSHHVEEDEPEIEGLLPYKHKSFLGDTRSKVSFGDHSNQGWQRKSPNNPSSGDTFQEINGQNVHLHFHSPVETVHVGDKETKYIFSPKGGTDTINNNSCAFNRFALERKTH